MSAESLQEGVLEGAGCSGALEKASGYSRDCKKCRGFTGTSERPTGLSKACAGTMDTGLVEGL